MSIKLVLAIISSILAIVVFIPYFRDIFRKQTQPHMYSWLIWSILQIIGTAAALKAGSGYGSWSLAVGASFCFVVFLLSFKYGTKNIKRFDIFCLLAAFASLVFYLAVNNPLWSVILVALTDFIAFLPTMRKAYEEPGTETMSTYFLSAVANVVSILAVQAYSVTTLLYLVTLLITNSALCLILVSGRKKAVKQIP